MVGHRRQPAACLGRGSAPAASAGAAVALPWHLLDAADAWLGALPDGALVECLDGVTVRLRQPATDEAEGAITLFRVLLPSMRENGTLCVPD